MAHRGNHPDPRLAAFAEDDDPALADESQSSIVDKKHLRFQSQSNLFEEIHLYLANKMAGAGEHGRLGHFQRLLSSISINLNNEAAVMHAIQLSFNFARPFKHRMPGKNDRYYNMLQTLSTSTYADVYSQYDDYRDFLMDTTQFGGSAGLLAPPIQNLFDSLKMTLRPIVATTPYRSRSTSPNSLNGWEAI